jgi:serine protease Do
MIQMNPRFPGQGSPGDDQFRRFFEEFFGGRLGENIPVPGQPRMIPKKFEKTVPLALGTGFVIDASEGLILTNHHVIQNAEEVKIQLVEEDQDLIPAEIIGKDPELDVALLKVKTKMKLNSISLGDSDAIDVGEYVVAIGNPLGYGHSVSHGILSAKGRRNPEFKLGKYLQTDASINPGNSGGPLLNVKGEVIGINNAIDARAQGIGFAIPINMVKAILPQLKTKGSVSRGYLGVSAGDLNPETIEQLKLKPNTKGVLIVDLPKGQPADRAGLKPFDVITEVNGMKVMNAQDLTAQVTSIPVGQIAKISYLRNGKEKTIEVKVAERPL